MLYKNKCKKYTDEMFKSPSSEYRGTPFWSWNTKLEEGALRRDIACLDKMGFGGFNMHPRAGMATKYLSEDFMNCVKACVDEAKKRGMYAWLYDEDKWPSGFAGGYVTKIPEYRFRFLRICENMLESEPKDSAISNGERYFVAAYDVMCTSDGRIVTYKRIDEADRAEGRKMYAYCDCIYNSPWYNNTTYIDAMNPDAVKKFVEITHEKYKENVGTDFGGTIPAVFTDEPQFLSYALPYTVNNSLAEINYCKPWTPDFDETFKREYGYSIIDKLPEILFERADGVLPEARYHYMDHITTRFDEAFAKTCGEWCEKNGIAFSGHINNEHTLSDMTLAVGDPLRFYKHMQLPGVDLLCDKREFGTFKQCQSAVHQYGREGMLSELYGVTGWDFDFRGHKLQGDWQAALGVTIRVPHLSWLSMNGDAKRDYPASIGHQSAWYTEYRYVEDHFARVASILTRGKPKVKVGVIFPLESYWLYFGPNDLTGEKRAQLQADYNTVLDSLLFGLVDFDLISEGLLKEQAGEITDELTVGEMKYSTILLPALETVRSTTLDLLEKFADMGGKVIFAGGCPTYVDGKPSNKAKALYEKSIHCRLTAYDMCNALEAERLVDIRLDDGTRTNNFIYNMRTEDDCDWLFIAHCTIQKPVTDSSHPQNLHIKIRGEYAPMLYDTVNGEIKEISYRVSDGFTYIDTLLYYHDSLMLRLNKHGSNCLLLPEIEAKKTVKTIDFKHKVKYARNEENVLLLDRARWSLDGGELNEEEEILKLDNLCRSTLGLPTKPNGLPQPWAMEPEVLSHKVRLVFEINSECDLSGVKLALEDAEKAEILFNGERIANTAVGYYVDECYKTVALPNIKEGKNTLDVTLPCGMTTNTEWCYLIGDFDVKASGAMTTLLPPSDEITFGSITTQGLPFYGGILTYKTEIDVPDCDLRLHANRYRGAMVKIRIDGEEKGCIVYEPYTLKADGIKAGRHTVEFTVYLSRYNTFGSMHNISDNNWIGPNHWYSNDDKWCYEYVLKDAGILASPVIEILE